MPFALSTPRWRRLFAATTVLATTALGPVVTTTAAGATTPATPSGTISGHAPGKTTATTVTLVTGDTVTVTKDAEGRERATVEPAPGSSRTFQTVTGPDGDLYVYPSDALAPLAARTLDSAVFDVSRLIRDGYADARKSTLPVIVSYADRPSGRTLGARADDLPGSTRHRVMDRLGMAALTVDKKNAESFWNAALPPATAKTTEAETTAAKTTGAKTTAAKSPGGAVAHLWYDAPVKATLDHSVPQIHAPEVWEQGYDGTGTQVAVLDTGIDLQHADVKDRVVAAKSFVGTATVQDGHGHGTHVASTIAGSGADSGGKYKGVAPGASLLVGKVLGDGGSGADSGVIAGMEWAVEQGADIVSMSLGSPGGSESDPTSVALDRLSAESDTLFVVAAGNEGPGASTLGSPGVAESALTVGAVDRDDALASFSSRGPRTDEDGGIKPDVTAPGVDIVAARAAGTTMGTPVDAHYTAASGTSMATPHVAGAAALLVQRHPDWDGEHLKRALVSHTTATPGATVYEQGTGRVDVAASLDAPVNLSGKADFGTIWYPGRGVPYEKQKRTLTVDNPGDKPTTVRLGARSTTETLPPGALTFDHDEVTVPAGGTTEVTATLDPELLAAATYSGDVTATTADGATARAALGFTKEPEQYGVTVRFKDRNGDTPARGLLIAMGLDKGSTSYQTLPLAGSSRATLRLPRGRYALFGSLTTGDLGLRGGFGDAEDVFSLPDVRIDDTARELTVDARTARDFRLDVKGEHEALESSTFSYGITRTGGEGGATLTLSGDAAITDAHHGAIPAAGEQTGLTAAFYQRERVPLVTARTTGAKGFPLSVRVAGGSPRFDGSRTAPVVDVGTGTPEEFAGKDLKGHAVLVHADLPEFALDALNAAQEAGATAVLVTPVHDRSVFAQSFSGLTVPLLAVSYKDGTALAARAAGRNGATVRLTGTEESPRAYSGRWDFTDGIPSRLSPRVRTADFARVDDRFHASAEGQLGTYQQHVAKEAGDPLEVRVPEELLLGEERREYLYATPGLTYQQDVSPAPSTVTHLLGAAAPARAGRTSTEDWFGPVTHSAPHGGYLPCNYCNTEGGVLPWPAMVGDSDARHSSAFGGTLNRLSLSHDGTELPADNWRLPERGTYRIDTDISYGPEDGAREGARATAAYDFVAGPPTGVDKEVCTGLLEQFASCEPLPVISTHYSLATDLHNKVAAGKPYSFTLSGLRVTGFKGATRLAGARVDVSFDEGGTWQHAKTARTGGDSFRVSYPQPRRTATSGTVALRATLWDGAGNRTEETVQRAYTLK